MNKKQILKATIFLLLTALILVFLCELFEYENSHMSERYNKYRQLEKDTVDAIYIGTSAVDRYWIAGQAFNDYGMTVYPLSTNGQPVWLIKNMIVEGFRSQNPQLVIIDVRSFDADITKVPDITDARSRYFIDMVDFFGLNRLDAINRTQEVMSDIDESVSRYDPSYYFSFIKYHSKWSKTDGLSYDKNLKTVVSPYLGFYMHSQKSVRRVSITDTVYTDDRMALEKHSEKYLYELLDYLRENDINTLFVNSPHSSSYEHTARLNTVWDIISQSGFDYVDFNSQETLSKCPFDFDRDFFEDSHANYYGAIKYTAYFSEYLDLHYDLPDRRSDERCAEWGPVEKLIADRIALWEKLAK